MKTTIAILIFALSFLGAKGQEKQAFRKFKQLEWSSELWIVPLDIYEQFKPYQEEAIKNDFWWMPLQHGIMDKIVEEFDDIDPLVFWLDKTIQVFHDSTLIPEAWREVGSESLLKRLRQGAEERLKNAFNRKYFGIYFLRNNEGKVLTVYFCIHPKLVDLVKEEELLAIRDAFQNTPFDPSCLRFSHPDRKIWPAVEEVLTSIVRPKFESSSEDYREIRKQTEECLEKYRIPCVYRLFEYTSKRYTDPNPVPPKLPDHLQHLRYAR